MKSKIITIDNTKGHYSKILISSIPKLNFLDILTRVRIYDLNSKYISELSPIEYFSINVILKSNQSQFNSFYIPISKSKHRIEILICEDIDTKIDDFIIHEII